MYKRNNNGPSIEPCGTPHFRSAGSENADSTLTKNVLLDKYDLNQDMVSFEKFSKPSFPKSKL